MYVFIAKGIQWVLKNHRQYIIISIEIKKIMVGEIGSWCAVVNYTHHGVVFYGVNTAIIYFNKHNTTLLLRHYVKLWWRIGDIE